MMISSGRPRTPEWPSGHRQCSDLTMSCLRIFQSSKRLNQWDCIKTLLIYVAKTRYREAVILGKEDGEFSWRILLLLNIFAFMGFETVSVTYAFSGLSFRGLPDTPLPFTYHHIYTIKIKIQTTAKKSIGLLSLDPESASLTINHFYISWNKGF